MLGADHENELVVRHGRTLELSALHVALDESEVRRSGLDRLRHLGGVANLHADVDPGMGAPEGDEVARQPIARDGLAGLDRKGPALEIAEFAQRQFSPFNLRQDGLGLREQGAARFGQLDAPTDPVEQLCVMPRFQGGDRVAGRRLGEIHGLGSLRHMLALGDRHENPKLVERHAAPIQSSS